MTLPASVAINAWRDGAAQGELGDRASRWGAGTGLPHSQQAMELGEIVDPTNWASASVGYGVLLLDDDSVPEAVRAVGGDAPDPVRELVAARPGTVVLRWRKELGLRFLRRYFADGSHQDPTIGLSTFGTAKGSLPRYVVIIGGPDVIPWSVQYALETRHAVGRLPLDDEALGNYLSALLVGFGDADLDARAPLMWTVSHNGDITAEMRAVIADPLAAKLVDPQLERFEHLTDASATGTELLARLTVMRPALVVTSSHGLAAGDADALRAGLGLPVDVGNVALELGALVDAMPSGAVWYAQACCSAGGDAQTNYAGLLAPGDVLDAVEAVATLGATVAPAAVELLGRPKPVRAVVGHVEPTFDWTLRVAETGQGLGGHLVEALSTNLFRGQPIGYAFEAYRSGVGELHSQWAGLYDQLAKGSTGVREELTRLRLTAVDRQSLVLLGDPTATLPPLDQAP